MDESSSLLQFRGRPQTRLDRAIARFNSGELSSALFEEFVELLDEGMLEASYFLGMYYEDGAPGVEQDLQRAYFYYKLSADRLGYVEGGLALARMLYFGRGTSQDFASAFSLYERISDATGNAIASFMRGRMLFRGEGTLADDRTALQWIMAAVGQGYVFAMVNLADLHFSQGRPVCGALWRMRAGIAAMRISWRDPKDKRLRHG